MPVEYPGVYPVALCAGVVAAVHAHRHAQWQVGHGFLGLPNRAGYGYCTAARSACSRFAVRLLLGCVAHPPATACGVGVYLAGKLSRQFHHCFVARGWRGRVRELRLRGAPRPGRPVL